MFFIPYLHHLRGGMLFTIYPYFPVTRTWYEHPGSVRLLLLRKLTTPLGIHKRNGIRRYETSDRIRYLDLANPA